MCWPLPSAGHRVARDVTWRTGEDRRFGALRHLMVSATPVAPDETWAATRSVGSGGLYVGSSKDDLDPGIMQLFRLPVKRVLAARSPDLPSEVQGWASELSERRGLDGAEHSATM